MMTLALSSRNPHKVAEIETILSGLPVRLKTAASLGVPEVEETGTTFEDNALLKAAAAWSHSGVASMADDSGIVVEALQGAPGVYSARFAGENVTYQDNNAHMLRCLEGVPTEKRGAAFVCTVVLLLPTEAVHDEAAGAGWRRVHRADVPEGAACYVVSGRVEGRVLDAARGEGGFGYDPLFLYEGTGRTFAEMSPAEKHAVSHRGQALLGLRRCLDAVLRAP
jgi:XTP/dITP diphosphohydrolase